jgi:hypothetical protein
LAREQDGCCPPSRTLNRIHYIRLTGLADCRGSRSENAR